MPNLYDKIKAVLEKDLSEKVADEILGIVERLMNEGMDIKTIEQEILQHLQHHIERDVNATLKILNGPPPTKSGVLARGRRKR
jgi:hypothetical protein